MDNPYLEVISYVERIHRQFLEVVKLELEGFGIRDINNVQAMMLFNIGDAEMTVGELTAFAEAADHIIYQANNYSAWLSAAGLQPLAAHLGDREQLRQSGLLNVVDPDTAIRMIRSLA